jgi:hypothetical protein
MFQPQSLALLIFSLNQNTKRPGQQRDHLMWVLTPTSSADSPSRPIYALCLQ